MSTEERSAEAKRSINPGTLRAVVYDSIWDSKAGRTDDEIEELTGLRHQTASARRRELVQHGAITASGAVRPTRSGRNATVWIVANREGAWGRHRIQAEALGMSGVAYPRLAIGESGDPGTAAPRPEVTPVTPAPNPIDAMVVDGKNVLYWAYHASKKSGDSPRSKFQMAIAELRDTYEPEQLIVAWDAEGLTWRHEAFPNYKAHRPEIDPLLAQLNNEIEVIVGEIDGVRFVEAPGYEADDIIGTLATQALAEGKYLTIVTTDKDIMQVVSDPYIDVLDRQNNVTRSADVVEKWGVPPKLIPDILALVGDSSDNLPGIPGIGKKTAPKLLNQYGSLDGVIAAAQAGTITGKRRERILAAAESSRKIKHLATLTMSVPGIHFHPPVAGSLHVVSSPPATARVLGDVPGDNPSRGYAMVLAMWAVHSLTGEPAALTWEVALTDDLNEPDTVTELGYGPHGKMHDLTRRIGNALALHQNEPDSVKATIALSIGAQWHTGWGFGLVSTGWRVNVAHLCNRPPPVGRWAIVASSTYHAQQPEGDISFFLDGVPF